MTTTIEKMAKAHFDFLEGAGTWQRIGPAGQALHLSAMTRAIEAMPGQILVRCDHGTFTQELASARDSLLDELAAARGEIEEVDHAI